MVSPHFLVLGVEAARTEGLLVAAVLGEPLELGALEGERALVLVDAAAV